MSQSGSRKGGNAAAVQSLPPPGGVRSFIGWILTSLLVGVVVLVVWEIGQAVWVYRALEEAAREGARYAIVHGSSSKRSYTPQAIEKEVLAALPGWEPGELEVTVRGGRSPGSVVEVEVTHRLDLGVTCWMFARDHWKLTARARMRVFR